MRGGPRCLIASTVSATINSKREPAYRLLATDGVRSAGQVLIKMNSLIDAPRAASNQSVAQLQEMAQFEASFAAMLSALRGYTTTRNRIFRQEYEVNLAANEISWSQVWGQRGGLSADQQELLAQVQESRQAFLTLPGQIFPLLEGDRWREDLYLFRTGAVPLTDRMKSLLGEMTSDQQTQLVTDLDDGRRSLAAANQQILTAGVVAVLIGLVLAFVCTRQDRRSHSPADCGGRADPGGRPCRAGPGGIA